MHETIQPGQDQRNEKLSLFQEDGQQEGSAKRGESCALSFEQQSLWLLDRLNPGLSAYTLPICLRLVGRLNVNALMQSLTQVIRRHRILRTTFPMVDGQPVQRTAPLENMPFQVIDLRKEPAQEREDSLLGSIRREISKPFYLAEDLPVRAQIFRLDEQEHVFLLHVHRIVFDDYAETLLFQEVTTFYKAACEEDIASLPPLAHQYSEYVSWQRARLNEARQQTLQTYWKQQLAGIPALLSLPAAHPRSAIPSFRGSHYVFRCSQASARALQKLYQEEGVTPFIVLLTVWQILLYRYTCQEDICIGTSVSERTQREFQDIIGFFVNTLVLRSQLNAQLSGRSLLRQAGKTVQEAYEHRDLPFEQLVEVSGATRDPSYNPLFQVFFSFDDSTTTALPSFSEVEVTRLSVAPATAKFDLSLRMRETAEGLEGSLEYCTDLFEDPVIARMSGHFQVLLEALAAAPDQPVSTLPLLTSAEQQQILVEWNATESAYPHDACLHQLFEQQVELRPDEIAVVCEGRSLTYAQLNERANQLAAVLRALGIGPEVRVGICVERSVDMVAGLLGILKAGGAYVPFSLDDPRERLAFLFEDLGIRVLLTRQRYSVALLFTGIQIVDLDEEYSYATLLEEDATNQPTAESLAYIISTSGSTGKPKGVGITHRNVVRLVASQNAFYVSPQDTILQFAPLNFDASTFEIWGSLLNGARLVLFPPQQRGLDEVGQFIQQQHITTMWLTAGLFHQMIESQIERFQGVRQLLAGGDVLSVAHVRKALQALPACQLFNGYGPTENTIFTCVMPLTSQCDLSSSVPIGRPVSQTQVYILDPWLQPVPVGIPGELYAGGDGVARGYLNHPELTAERFIEHPFSSDPHARLYKTGDLTRYLEDGTLEFLGRNDQQVKIRGFRIELGEIEAVLGQHPAVQQGLVNVLHDPQGDKRLVAYIALQPSATTSRKELRKYLETQLPTYMIPSAFLFLDDFPLTPNGKIDRAALPEPGAESGASFVLPRSTTEAQIARMFSDLLGIPLVSVKDSFFELGGHSLSAMHLLRRFHSVFGQDIPMSVFFREPTVEKLAQFLYEKSEDLPAASIVCIQSDGAKPPLFFLHPASGTVFPYERLVSFMKPDQPVYAFEESYLSPRWKPSTSVEEMARYYVEMLLQFQPQGPYHLGGWSFGGLIAFEMALQLRQKGLKLGLLVMIDTYPPLPEYIPPPIDDTSLITWGGGVLAACWPNHPADYLPAILPESTLRQMPIEEQWEYITEIAIKINYADNTEQIKRWIKSYQNHVLANQRYKPARQSYPDRLVLLNMANSQETTQPSEIASRGWQEFVTGPIEIHMVEGDHFGIVGAAGPVLAQHLDAYMEQIWQDPEPC